VTNVSKVLILIPCSGSKRKWGDTIYNENSSILNYLTASYKEHLLGLRKRLFEYSSIKFGKDVGCRLDKNIHYLEAYRRYAGHIYCQISSSSWNKLKQNTSLDLVIVSALYGLLRYEETIQNYDLTMKDKIVNSTLKIWWKNNGLSGILKDYINKNKITKVYSVLSRDYTKALGNLLINTDVKIIYKDFSKYKSGSNAYRGKWVDSFIQNF